MCTYKHMHGKNLIWTHIYKYLPKPHEAYAGLHCGLPVVHAAVAVFECAQKRGRCHINASYIVQARHPMFQDCGCSSNCVFLCICRAKCSELLQAMSESTILISGGGTWFQEKLMGACSIGVPASYLSHTVKNAPIDYSLATIHWRTPKIVCYVRESRITST